MDGLCKRAVNAECACQLEAVCGATCNDDLIKPSLSTFRTQRGAKD